MTDGGSGFAAAVAAATRTLDVLLPALGAHAAARTRSVALLEAVRALLVALTVASVASVAVPAEAATAS